MLGLIAHTAMLVASRLFIKKLSVCKILRCGASDVASGVASASDVAFDVASDVASNVASNLAPDGIDGTF